MAEFAVTIDVAAETLSDWKKVDTFWEDVERAMKKWMRDRTPNVIAALYQGAIKGKKAQEIKLWLQYGLGWAEKHDLGGEAMEGVLRLEKTLRELFSKNAPKSKKG